MFAMLLALVCCLRVEAAEPMNLLIITADDMNADSPGWMGSTLGATPRLDALAGECFRFEQCHVSAPICQPSRSALMTGRVPHRNGALGFNPINRDVPTLVEILRGHGYFCAALNKIEHMKPDDKFPWDMTTNKSGKDPARLRSEFESVLAAAQAAHKPFFINANITDPHRPFPTAGAAASADEAGPAGDSAPTGKNRGKMADRQAAANTNLGRVIRPAEVVVPGFLEDIPAVRKEVAQYFTGVARFDVSLGGLLDALDASGQAGRTLLVFLSDHGMSFPFSKATVYRNGTWSPVIFRLPGQIEPGADRADLISSVDIMPTVLELMRVPAPPGMDGRSVAPLMRGQTQPGRDHVVTHVNTVSSGKSLAQRCVRTARFSLQFHAWVGGPTRFQVEAMSGLSYAAMAEAGRSDPRIKARVGQLIEGVPLAFYDLEKDPGERTNLIADARYRGDVDKLEELLLDHMQRTGDPELENFRRAVAQSASESTKAAR